MPDIFRIARETGHLHIISPELAEKEEALRLEREHAEYLAALKQGRLPPAQDATATPPPKGKGVCVEGEPDPRHRKTLLRIIGALADLAGIDDAMPPKRAAHAINSKLESMGQKGMKPDTIAAVITAARSLANETID